ncbi:MAG: hypothetical protein FWF92_10725 [Oscillospiraceae bacterium]|nr:hypothetical protein [Oscillospiraceae bacterium]
MNKNEFLQKLKEDLSSLSDDERLNALKYYEEYFADAGEDKTGDNITEFMSPEDLAHKIQEEIAELDKKDQIKEIKEIEKTEETEENIENIYKEEIPEKEEIPNEIIIEIKKEEKGADAEKEEDTRNQWQYQKNIYNSRRPKSNNMLKIILLLCTAPFWMPLAIAAASVGFGLFMTLFGIAFAVASMALAGFIMIGAGFISVGYGITNIFIDMSRALYPIGAGFVVSGVGIIMAYLFTKLSMVMFKSQFKFVGWAVRGITNKFSKFSRQGA